MPYRKYPQSAGHVLLSRSDDTFSVHAPASRWQDKVSLARDPKASKQPASEQKFARSHEVSSNGVRAQSGNTRPRRKVPFTLHVDPIVKADAAEQARLDGISTSQEGSELLAWALRQKLHQRHAATFESVVEAIIDRKIGRRDARLAHLLVRNLFAAEQNRMLTTQILRRMPGVTDKVLNDILDTSAKAARHKITYRNPLLKDILTELEEMLARDAGEEEKPATE